MIGNLGFCEWRTMNDMAEGHCYLLVSGKFQLSLLAFRKGPRWFDWCTGGELLPSNEVYAILVDDILEARKIGDALGPQDVQQPQRALLRWDDNERFGATG